MTTSFDWQGRVGDAWAQEWRRTDRSLADLSRHLDAAILALAPETGRALDIGAGAGATSLALAGAGPGLHVHGVDLSADLVAVARTRAAAAGLDNLDFAVADASVLPRGPLHDLAVSRHGVMFFPDPALAFAALHRAAVPGAPLVFSCFRPAHDNGWAVALAEAVGQPVSPPGTAPGPFAFADPGHVTAILSGAGWRNAAVQPVDFTYVAGGGPDPVEDALAFFRRIGPVARLLADAPASGLADLLDRLRAMLASRCRNGTVAFPAAAWLWSAQA